MVKDVIERKEALKDRDEPIKERCIDVYKEERRKEVNKQLGMKMNQGVCGNRKLFWKEVV